MAKVRDFVSKEPNKWKYILEEDVEDDSQVLLVYVDILSFFFAKERHYHHSPFQLIDNSFSFCLF